LDRLPRGGAIPEADNPPLQGCAKSLFDMMRGAFPGLAAGQGFNNAWINEKALELSRRRAPPPPPGTTRPDDGSAVPPGDDSGAPRRGGGEPFYDPRIGEWVVPINPK